MICYNNITNEETLVYEQSGCTVLSKMNKSLPSSYFTGYKNKQPYNMDSYKTKVCKLGPSCTIQHCWYAHSPSEIRPYICKKRYCKCRMFHSLKEVPPPQELYNKYDISYQDINMLLKQINFVVENNIDPWDFTPQ